MFYCTLSKAIINGGLIIVVDARDNCAYVMRTSSIWDYCPHIFRVG